MRRWVVIPAVTVVAGINLAMFGGMIYGATGSSVPAREVREPRRPTTDARRAIFAEKIAPLLNDDNQGLGWYEDDGRTRVVTLVNGAFTADAVATIEALGAGMHEDLRIEWTEMSMNDLYRVQAVVAEIVRAASREARTNSSVGLGVVDGVSVIDAVVSPAAHAVLKPKLAAMTAEDLAGLDPGRVHFTVVDMSSDPHDKG